ncbi:hypothetical protein MKX54_14205 [Alkalihalobacillus sp. FSL R5-0424]
MAIDAQARGFAMEIAKEAIKEYERLRSGEHKRRHDNRLRNIKLLLKNYRSFKKHGEEAKEDIPELMRALDLDELSQESFQIKSILANRKRTLAMTLYIERMLNIYKASCDENATPEDKRSYQVIYDLYLDPKRKTAEEVAIGHNLNRRTIYKDVDRACKALSVLMFGVDGVLFEEF